VLALGLPVIGYGLLYTRWLCIVGGLIVVAAIYGWALEPPDDPDAVHGDDHGPDDHSAEGDEVVTGEAGDEAGDDTAGDEAASAGDKEVETVG